MFELGLTSFAEAPPEPVGGKLITHGERLRNVVAEIEKADQVGLDVYGLGEHHRIDMAASAPAITLAAAAALARFEVAVAQEAAERPRSRTSTTPL